MKNPYQITEFCHHFLKDYIGENDCCIDATREMATIRSSCAV